ncbi:elicitor-responsive protein 3 [Sesamum indicum]|uniref:Elicitor-responsive protein 3 n=1 Tax=Sesamum indicum TaxID=4182 RepID=A0A8M8UVX3_SESIN|nr:elicitor-responsive protein 3 [Sesamum indicum]
MKGAVLEVLLVSAEGIDHRNIVGTPTYHVIVLCGTQVCRSKTSSGNPDKIYWNEKFTFELPPSELENLSHLKLRIVNEEYFTDGEFVGETIIFLKGIIVESNYKGLVELNPAPFNVVLEDDTYKGQITVGLKFIPNTVLQMNRKQCIQEERDIDESLCKMVVRLWEMPWWGHLFSNKHKEN